MPPRAPRSRGDRDAAEQVRRAAVDARDGQSGATPSPPVAAHVPRARRDELLVIIVGLGYRIVRKSDDDRAPAATGRGLRAASSRRRCPTVRPATSTRTTLRHKDYLDQAQGALRPGWRLRSRDALGDTRRTLQCGLIVVRFTYDRQPRVGQCSMRSRLAVLTSQADRSN